MGNRRRDARGVFLSFPSIILVVLAFLKFEDDFPVGGKTVITRIFMFLINKN